MNYFDPLRHELPQIRIAVLSFQSESVIEKTFKSLAALNYDPKKIFINFVDFGSVDRTAELIQDWISKFPNSGFFMLTDKRRGRSSFATAWKSYALTPLQGQQLTLCAGDMLYESCLLEVVKYQYLACKFNSCTAPLVAFEVDIEDDNNNLIKQQQLFTKPCFMSKFTSDCLEFIKTGHSHQILTVGGINSLHRNKTSIFLNQRRNWNTLVGYGLFSDVVYIPKALGICKKDNFEDPLDEAAYRAEFIISYSRAFANIGQQIEGVDSFVQLGMRQVAFFCLSQAVAFSQKGELPLARKLILFSRVVFPQIVNDEVWAVCRNIISQAPEKEFFNLESFIESTNQSLHPKNALALTYVSKLICSVKRLAK